VVASCGNGVRDGLETDVDCGGPLCDPCVAGKACQKPFDCQTLLCGGQLCQALGASCTNGVQDGSETGVDCGGPDCGACPDGSACGTGGDCRSGVCGSAAVCCRNWARLAWTAPQQNTAGACVTSLAGFRVYAGTTSGTYARMADLPLGDPNLACTDSGLAGPCGNWMTCGYTLTVATGGVWYMATTAYDRAGAESVYSNEVSKSFTLCP
jgi:hypothetical protein